ncbi:MAG: SpoVR family protein [Syntrophomonadaceae bacterium]|jgi:stage V sporulation protein R|nr:SpoVR family protein [Syntrophomonadaceae bacterium]
MTDLEYYNRIIEQATREFGLDCYPQDFEICDYEDMLSYEAYSGMPSRYPHWSFGKAWERKKTFYRYNLIGLPYEMVINSNPCLAYLMKENTLALQVLTIAHVYGHNDFFKNNRLFKNGTRADYTVEMFKSHASRISDYIADPSIGYERVERILDAAHALRFQVYRISNEKHLSPEEIKESHMEKYYKAQLNMVSTIKDSQGEQPNWDKIPLEPEEDILLFLLRYARLSEWEKDIISIVRSEAQYFMPQMETKIMNEGWASFWHFKILNHINLRQPLYLEFIKRHNQVIASRPGTLNPYHLGFKIFCKLEQEGKQLFDIREQERDVSFIRRYLDEELCQELNLFEFQKEKQEYVIREISDESGWKKIRDTLIMNVGMNGIPVIKVSETDAAKILHLEQEWDGRELLQDYAHKTIKYIARLWGNKVRLRARINGEYKLLESDGV